MTTMSEHARKLAEDHIGYAERIARYEVPGYVRRRLGHDDVLSICLLGLCRAACARQPGRDFLPLAKVSMVRLCMLAYKRERYQAQWAQLCDEGRPLAEVCLDARVSDAEKGWLVEGIEAALGRLRPRQREALRRHYLNGESYKEMGPNWDDRGQRALARLRHLYPDGI
jgi:RNA polymerase sigma factor (sigma-70 family)